MHPNHPTSLPSREIPHAASPRAAQNQILMLQRELVHALERAAKLRRWAQSAEHQLRQARRELAQSKADGRERLRVMRIELLASEARCWALEEVCRALVLTIEQAACSELGEPSLAAGAVP